ncbi:MAG: hypothetical protein L0154_29605 [Chloroflexi bacterium]|nr:hypothetical protein [Chloroflexota bacterium]
MRFTQLTTVTALLGLSLVIGSIVWAHTDAQRVDYATQPEDRGIYDPDPDHIWNRVFQHFYTRVDRNGNRYGLGRLEPLLWAETNYLLERESYQQAIALLDEFLNTNAANLIDHPLKRAFFQRDIWAVFDWLAIRPDDRPAARFELQSRLAQIMQQVALSDAEIETLPTNYQDAIGQHVETYQPDAPLTPYLPPDLFDVEGTWVNVGREGGPIAMTHVTDQYISGRSLFLVFLRLPDEQESTLSYVRELHETPSTSRPPFLGQPPSGPHPSALPVDAQVAFVQQMLVVNDRGEIVPTPITLSIQLRYFQPPQAFYQFNIHRPELFGDVAGGLQPVMPGDLEFSMLNTLNLDFFEQFPESPEQGQSEILESCMVCHERQASDVLSVISYSRDPFPLPDGNPPLLVETRPEIEANMTTEWKVEQGNWQQLMAFWRTR